MQDEQLDSEVDWIATVYIGLVWRLCSAAAALRRVILRLV